MSTIDGYWLSFGTITAARGRCARFWVFLQPSGSALIGCARNRKSFRHMGTGIKDSEPYVYYYRSVLPHFHLRNGRKIRLSLDGRTYINTYLLGWRKYRVVLTSRCKCPRLIFRKWWTLIDACDGRFVCVCPVGTSVRSFIYITDGSVACLWPIGTSVRPFISLMDESFRLFGHL